MKQDIVFCQGLELDLEIGFHDVELGIKQTVRVDLTLEADFGVGPSCDVLQGLVDYYEISRLLEKNIAGRRYKLVEALAEEIARVVLVAYPTVRVRVRVTKRPLDMPRAAAVGVECVRTAADFAAAAPSLQAPRLTGGSTSGEDRLDLIVLGAGPAGLSAAVTAQALGLRTLVLDACDRPGGQLLLNPTPILDCAGLSSQTGVALAERLVAHLASLGGSVRTRAEALRVDAADGALVVQGERLSAKFLLLATGARRRTLGIPGEGAVVGRGPSPAARRYGSAFRGRTVLVVGGGDVALEEATLFAQGCERVILVHRGQAFRARADFRAAVEADPRIDVRMETTLLAVEGEPEVERALLRGPQGTYRVDVAGVFICAGLAPNSELVQGQVDMDAQGFVTVDTRQRTSAPRVYAAGDLCAGAAWTVAAALGQASIAVKDMERRLARDEAL